LIALGAGCQAEQPLLTDAHGALDGRCSGPHADQLLDFSPPTLAMPTAALGAPDNVSVSLTQDAVITVGFIGLGAVTNAPGNDVRIHATIASGASALVRVAGVDQHFFYTGTLDPSTSDFDLGVSTLQSIVYLRIIDVTGLIQVDAIEAIHDMCR